MTIWIDTHCHLDAPEFDADRTQVRAAARAAEVAWCVIPAVQASTWQAARDCAHAGGDAYALGIHPLYTPQAQVHDLALLQSVLTDSLDDSALVAVGEIGLDYFVSLDNSKQELFFREQLRIAKHCHLPVILHVRRSVDKVLSHLRQQRFDQGGIAHAFNGSLQQAHIFLDMGFKLGFGGAVTYERALQLRRLACQLPPEAIVMETDAPDIQPHWLYVSAEQRAQGQPQGRNTPAQLARIGQEIASLRGLDVQDWMEQTSLNAMAALPRLAKLIAGSKPDSSPVSIAKKHAV